MKKIISIALTVVLLLSGCGSKSTEPETTAETKPPFDLAQYKQDVAACAERISAEGLVVYNVAKKERDYMKTFENISGKTAESDDAKETAFQWLEEKSDYSAETVDAGYKEISQMYKDIIVMDIEGTEAAEIKSEFDEYATAYIDLYNLAMAPSGSAYGFGEECDVCISALKSGQSKLDILLS